MEAIAEMEADIAREEAELARYEPRDAALDVADLD